jgi:hypothetical protein
MLEAQHIADKLVCRLRDPKPCGLVGEDVT